MDAALPVDATSTPFLCTQRTRGPFTLIGLGSMSIYPSEAPIGLMAAAVLIAPAECPISRHDGLSARAKIGLSVGVAMLGVLLLAGTIVSLLWWRRKKSVAVVATINKGNGGFELLSKS